MAVLAAGGLTSFASTSLPCCSSTHRQYLHRASPLLFWRTEDFTSAGLHSGGLQLRRGRRFARAAQSSANNENVAGDILEITKQRLRELSESLVLPSNYLEKLPSDLRVDLKDAAFALSSGALKKECGEQAGDLLMQLSLACERGDTQAAAASAKKLPTLVDKMPNESSSEFVGRRFIRAGRYFTATGKYDGVELEKVLNLQPESSLIERAAKSTAVQLSTDIYCTQKIGKAMISAGEAMSRGNLPVTETKISTTRELKFGALQVEITAQQAYIGAAVSLVFGLLSWQLTSGLQNQSDSSLQYANDNALLLATSLRGALLAAGYFCAALSASTMVGLLVLGSTIDSEKKQ